MLGLPQLAAGLGEALRRIGSRLAVGLDLTGRFPGLQPEPPVVPLTDPANLEPDAPPAVQAAAKIKAEEDAAPQKIMAIRYLATLGCGGCYEDVESSLLAAMSDCTEEVRFEAVKALQCRPDCGCRYCKSPSCCSEPVRKRLEELTTCEKEPSARINRVARLALACCNSKPLTPDEIPREGPTPAPAQEEPQAASILAPGNDDPVAALFASVQLASHQPTTNQSVFQPVSATSQPGQMVVGASRTERVLAVVNNEQILESQLLPIVEAKRRQIPTGQIVHQDHALMTTELNRLIDWVLIRQMARAELSAVMPASASGQPVEPTLSALETQAWLERKLAFQPQVSPAEVMAYYQIHLNEFMAPARLRWESLTILASQCKSSEEVAAVATFVRGRALGQNIEAPAGFQSSMVQVEVGTWQDLPQISARHQEILAALQPGQISQPIQVSNDLCLLRLLAREPSQPIPLSAVAARITQEIIKQRRQAALNHFLAQARANSRIWNAFDAEYRPQSVATP